MLGRVTLAIAGLSTALACPALAQDEPQEAAPPSLARGAAFISFDGMHELRAVASRQGLLSSTLGFVVTVGPDGKATDCDILRDFRRRVVEIQLCRPLLRHLRFQPALDARGEPTTGRYRSQIRFNMWMKEDGYLEPHMR